MESTKIDQLIRRLLTKTEALELKWKEGSRGNTYEISFPRQTVVVEKSGGGDIGQAAIQEYFMRILDERGKVAVNLLEEGFGSATRAALGGASVRRLYDAARRSARDSGERVIDDLLAQLN